MANNTIGLQAIVDVTQFNQGLRLYIKGMLQMSQATTQASTQINRLGVAASAGLGAALGTTAVNAIGSVVSSLRSMVVQIGENISSFQSLTLALNFFTARALQEQNKGLPLADALAQTREEAQGLLLWVEKLAVLSPFTAEQVGNALRTAQAYGLSLGAAQKLVPLMVNFAAVNNLSAELLQRISLAIAQIQARGKLASQEINQLANAGLPIRSLLVSALDVTAGELEKMLEDGLVPAGVAIQAVTDYLEGFGGAAERVTRGTLKGLISSLQDIRDISSRDLFGPMVSSFFPVINQLIDIANSTQFKAGIKVIGQELGEGLAARIRLAISQISILVQSILGIPGPMLQAAAIFVGFSVVLVGFTAVVGLLAASLSLLINPFTLVVAAIAGFVTAYSTNFRGLREITTNTVNAVSSALSSMARVISSVVSSAITIISDATSTIGELSSTVLQYGAAVVQAFSAGITGALGLLVDSMQLIGQVLSFWLSPGSPPKVAPDLDKWGTGAANEWLKGWLAADFNILSNISRDIGNVLSSLVSSGNLDELAVPRILRALRTELAGAVGEFRRFGAVSEDTMNRVARSAGPAANQVRELFKAYVAVAAETEIVRQAQERLNEITERYDAILTPLRKKLSDISELRQQADEQREILSLSRTINNAGVSAARKQAARLRIQEIMAERQVRGIEKRQEAEEDAADTELKAAQKRRDVAQEGLDRTKAMIEIQNEQLNLYGEELAILEKIRKEQERLAREARQRMLEQLRKQLEIAQLLSAELRDAVGVFKAQHTLADETATAAEKAAAALELQAILGRRIVRNFEAAELGIDPSQIQAIRDTLITLEDIGIKAKKGDLLEGFSFEVDDNLADLKTLVDEMNTAMQDVRGMLKDTRTEIDLFLDGINDMLPGFLKFRKATNAADSSVSDHLRTQRAATKEFKEWPPLFKTLSTAFAGIASGLITSRVLTTLPKLLVGLGGPVGIITALVSTLAAAWTANWLDIRGQTKSGVDFVKTKLDEFFTSEGWVQFAQDVVDAVALIRATLVALGRQFQTVFKSVISPILNEGLSFDSILSSLRLLRGQVKAVFLLMRGDISEEAKATAAQLGSDIRTFIGTYWNPFLAILLLSSRTVINAFSTIFSEIIKQFAFLPRLISFTLRTILTLFGIGLKGLAPLVAKALSPINNLILRSLGGLGHAIAAVIVSPFKLLGKLVNLNAIISGLVTQFTTGFAGQIIRNAPKMWRGLLTGLLAVGTILDKTMITLFSGAIKAVSAVFKLPTAIFDVLNKMTFAGFRVLSNVGVGLPRQIAAISAAFRAFGGITDRALANFGIRIFNLILSLDRAGIAVLDFVSSGNRLQRIGALLPGVFSAMRGALEGLIGGVIRVADVFDRNLLTVFASAGRQSASFLANIIKIGAAIGGKFVNVFRQFKGVGPTIGAAFGGIAAGLRNLSLTGSIKILDFFDGLSKGILTFAGKGQAKLGKALAGIFQGAFKGITGAITGAPNFIGTFFKNLNLGALGQAAKIKGPVVLQEFFSTLGKFKPGNIVKGIGSVLTSLKNVSKVFGGFLNPINLVIAAFDFFGFAFRNNIDGVENRAVSFVNTLKQGWADLISGKLWQDIAGNAGKAFQFITEVWTEFQTNGINSPRLREMLTTAGQNILTWITTAGAEFMVALREFWLPMFGTWIRESIENLGVTLGNVLIFIRDWIVIAGTWLGARIAEAWTFFWTWWTEQGGAEKTGEWLNGIIDLIVGWITASATFLYENFVSNWLPAFVDWLTEGGGLNTILTKLSEFLIGIGTWIVTVAAPWLIEKLLTWATAFLQWLGPAAAGAIVGLGKLLGSLVQWIIGTGVPMLVGGVFGLIGAMVNWISGGEGSAEELAPTKLGEFLKTVLDFFTVHVLPALATAGGEILKGFWQGFVDLSEEITATETGKAIEDFLSGVQLKILEIRAAGLQMGKDFIDGIVEAFTTYVAEPYQAIKDWIWGAVGAGEEAAEANSPSEITKRLIGEPLAAGIVKGFETLTDSPIFKTVRNLAVKGLAAFREDGTEEVDDFSGGSLKIVNELYASIVAETTAFATLLTTAYTTFLTALVTLLNDYALKAITIWSGIRTDSITEMGTMASTIVANLGLFSLSLTTAMNGIKNVIVGSFTTANTESVAEVKKLTTAILGVLVGRSAADQTSVTYQIKDAMTKAGKLVGAAFVAGLAFVFTDELSLNPLWLSIDSLVTQIVGRFRAKLAVGSPSKLAANEIGKPIVEGIGLGIRSNIGGIADLMAKQLSGVVGNNSMYSQLNSRPGTFLPSNVTNISRSDTYALSVNTDRSSQGVISDFGIMQTMAGY